MPVRISRQQEPPSFSHNAFHLILPIRIFLQLCTEENDILPQLCSAFVVVHDVVYVV